MFLARQILSESGGGISGTRYIRWRQEEDVMFFMEIRAFDKDNNNVALGKSVSGNNLRNPALAVDGIAGFQDPFCYGYNYDGAFLLLDLGSIYSIKKLQIWAYVGTRHIIDISPDGINWNNVFDYKIHGTFNSNNADGQTILIQ